jgi:hypothetical protein
MQRAGGAHARGVLRLLGPPRASHRPNSARACSASCRAGAAWLASACCGRADGRAAAARSVSAPAGPQTSPPAR